MAWLVWNWGDRWGTSGMGRTDRWGALRNAKGVVSSDRLESHAGADGFYCHTGLEFGTMGSELGQFLRSRLRQRRKQRFGAVPRLWG